jgi:hypothetical protein
MSALTTHTSNQFREKRKKKRNERRTQASGQKARKDHLREENLGPLRQGQRLDTIEIKMLQNFLTPQG